MVVRNAKQSRGKKHTPAKKRAVASSAVGALTPLGYLPLHARANAVGLDDATAAIREELC